MSKRGIRGFTFWENYYEIYRLLPTKKDKLEFVDAIFSYIFDENLVEFSNKSRAELLFTTIKPSLDNSIKKASNGGKGKGIPKTNRKQMKANESKMETNKKEEIRNKKEEIRNKKKEVRREKEEIVGTFENVILTHSQLEHISSIGATEYIDRLSTYMESSGKDYTNHYATILRWFNQDVGSNQNQFSGNLSNAVDDDELDRDAMLEEFEKMRKVGTTNE